MTGPRRTAGISLRGSWLLAAVLLAGCVRTAADDAIAATPSTTTPATSASPAATVPAANAPRAAGAAVAPTIPQAPTTPPAPGLPGLSAASGPSARGGHAGPWPPAIAAFLRALPTRDVLASPERRQAWLDGTAASVVDIARPGAAPDHLVVAADGPDFGVWVRSFHGSTPDVTGYLVQVRVRCRDAAGSASGAAAADARACATPDAEYADSGVRAYRVPAGQAPQDVTATLGDPVATLGAAALADAERRGASGVVLDDSRLDRVPVFRWIVEFDPEQPLPASDPRAFEHGRYRHAGFVVWNGDGFELRDTVPAALWPCPRDQPSRCADDDRFVTER